MTMLARKMMSNKWFIVVLITCVSMACSKKEDAVPSDPLIGVWHLRVVYVQGQEPVEVTNVACWKDSRLDVEEKDLTLTLLFPDNQGAGQNCQRETAASAWENEQGTYYLVGDNGRETGLTLNDDSQTLQLNLNIGGTPTALIFRK